VGKGLYEGELMSEWSEAPMITPMSLEERQRSKERDNVNKPAHYGQGSIECIEYIKDFLNDDELTGYYRGNVAKYLHRWRYKNGVEDLKKARWYLEALIQQQERK
jgi:hypothetical protein